MSLKLKLRIASATLSLIGIVIVGYYAGWQVALGLFIWQWGNAIALEHL